MSNLNDMSPIKQRFYMIFQNSGLTQTEFGKILGKSQTLIGSILRGERNVSGDMIQLLRYKMNVNPEFLLHGTTPMFLQPRLEGGAIPILADIPAGPWKNWNDAYPVGVAEEYISVPGLHGENLFAIRVVGDSMEPQLNAGDILVLDPHRPFRNGLAVVRHNDGYKIRNARNIVSDRWLLAPLNPAYEVEEITPDENTRFFIPVKLICIRDIYNV